MELEITEQNENPLLNRQEIKVVIKHNESSTPRRNQVIKNISEQLKTNRELVIIDHLNGYTTKYAHNNRNLVKKGDLIRKGQIIAKMGSTGHSTGPHVHLEVLKNKKHINPNKFMLNYINRGE